MDLLQLEKDFNFQSFTHEDALTFGLKVIQKVKDHHLKPVRIRVYKDNDIIFQYLMDGKTGDIWLNRKQNTVLKIKHSSLYGFVHQDNYQDIKDNEDYVLCGGGFPLIIQDEIRGCFVISGLVDTEDHQLIIDTLKEMREDK